MSFKNAGPFIREALNSIVNQSFSDWDLIAVDDGSTDESRAIMDEFAEKDTRIKVYSNEGNGIIDALRMAIQNSSGAYIHRMDADDIMPQHKLRALHELAGENRVVTGNVRYFCEDEVSEGYRRYEQWLNGLNSHDDYRKNLYRECVVASPNWLVSRKFFEAFDWSNWKYPEDYDLVFHWAKAGYEFVFAAEVTHLWREHPQRTSRNSDVYDQASFFELKTNWFLEIENPTRSVQVIGKGVKAKAVMKELKAKGVPFEQYHLVASGQIKSIHDIQDRTTILTSWPINEFERTGIQEFLASKNLHFGKNLWLF